MMKEHDVGHFYEVLSEYIEHASQIGEDAEKFVLEGLSEEGVETMKHVALRYFGDAVITEIAKREFEKGLEEVLAEISYAIWREDA